MDILYTCDNNYVWIMGISMTSLFENNKGEQDITVYLLGENISTENKKNLKNIAVKYKRACNIIDTPELNIPDILCSQRWPKSAFSRLYAGKLLPQEVSKVLYLDCDTIVTSNISNLWDKEIANISVSGVKDCIGKLYRKNIGLNADDVYLNAGVLLFNLSLLRVMNVSGMIDEFLKQYATTMHYADQDVLNGMFKGKVGVLPAEYDVMTLGCMYKYDEIMHLRHPQNYYARDEFEYAISKPRIIHFTTCMLAVRPWFKNSNHPYAKEFLYYKAMSPWEDKELLNSTKTKSKKNSILKVVFKLPKCIRNFIIGLVHTNIFPMWIRLKSEMH